MSDIAQLAELVFRDVTKHLVGHNITDSSITVADDPRMPGAVLVTLSVPHGGVHACRAGHPQDRDADILWQLADQFQDFVIDETQQAAPPCVNPSHAHPMSVELLDDRAVWLCPSDDPPGRFPVGSLV